MLNDGAPAADAEPPLTRERVERMRRAAAAQHTPPLSSAQRFRQQQAERQRKDRIRAAVVAWGATGVALAATTTSAVAFREDVARVWPKTASAYAAVGLDVNIFGLEFVDLQVEHVFDGPEPVLVVRGAVTNMGREARPAPVLRFGLRGADAREIQHVMARMTTATIPAGGAAPFEIRIENASVDAADLEATFASAEEAARMPAGVAAVAANEAPSPDERLDPPQIDGALTLDPFIDGVDGRAEASHDGLAPRLSEPWPEDHG
ncbi:MAG: hypothetical protein NW200_05645 [Hyphomonadaceae bacterium]|nr:hypothetical protein [Hyphomonadaceae bacterium]